MRNLLHLLGVPLVLLLCCSPFLLFCVAVLRCQLRCAASGPIRSSRRVPIRATCGSAALEDHDVTNQFSAFGRSSPACSVAGRWSSCCGLLDYAARHIYKRGHLARVQHDSFRALGVAR